MSVDQFKIEYIDRATLKRAKYNPRTISPEQLDAVCRSIVEFGIVDPFIVRKEDRLIIGGHQRDAALGKLLSGPFTYRATDGKKRTVTFELPGNRVPVVLVEGLDDKRAKLLNLALNRISGDWEHDALAKMLKELSQDVPIDDLMVSGFSAAEITDYIDLADEPIPLFDADGAMPQLNTTAPKIDLDFSSKELRDAVKTEIASKTKAGDLSGDALARMLGVKVPSKVRKLLQGTSRTRSV